MADEEHRPDNEESVEIYFERHSSGPLPTPDSFREYEDVLPGAADRILTMAETQLQHRASIQKLALWIAFIVAIGFLIGAVTLAFVATPAAAVLFPVVPILVSGGAYVYGLRKRSEQQHQLPPPAYSDSQRRLPDDTDDGDNT